MTYITIPAVFLYRVPKRINHYSYNMSYEDTFPKLQIEDLRNYRTITIHFQEILKYRRNGTQFDKAITLLKDYFIETYPTEFILESI